jgi:hypothetical protein
MSLFLPISSAAPRSSSTPQGSSAGYTVAVGTLSVDFHLAGQANGATAVQADLALQMVLEGVSAGSTMIEASLRLNDEPNILLAGVSAGSTVLAAAQLITGSSLAGVSAGSTTAAGTLTVAYAEELSFTFFVDVSSAALSAAIAKNIRRYSVGLVVDGTPVPILEARLEAPADRLGSELSVILAEPDISLITSSSLMDFLLFVWTAAGWEPITLLEGARLGGRAARYVNQEGLPADSVEITLIDAMADRWNKRPSAPITIYDSQVIDPPSVDQIAAQTIFTSGGGRITPLFEPVAGLMLKTVLARAYVAGCGFDHVITNLDNYPVEEASFTLQGGYDAGVRPLIQEFDPIMVVRGNDLWIVTLDNPLPAGFDASELPASVISGIDNNLPRRELINGLLVTVKDTGTGEFTTEREYAPPEILNGVYGSGEETYTKVEQRFLQYRDLAAPEIVKREVELYLKTRVLDASFNEISIDTRETL